MEEESKIHRDSYYHDMSKKELIEELEILESETIDLLMLCFELAGLKEKFKKNALNFYISLLDSETDKEYTKEQVKKYILITKEKNKDWFKGE